MLRSLTANRSFLWLGLIQAGWKGVAVDKLGGLSVKKTLIGMAVVIVAGGIVLGLLTGAGAPPSRYDQSLVPAGAQNPLGMTGALSSMVVSSSPSNYDNSQVIGNQGTTTMTTATTTTYTGPASGGGSSDSTQGITGTTSSAGNVTQGAPSGNGGLIEFNSQVTLQSASPQQAASQAVALAYSVGGYVAYQSTYSSSADVVIRVPSAGYQQALAKVEALGTVESLTSNSNDVRVQYTDLNATLESLQAEGSALLRLLNESASINSTLAIETQLQGVNQQINSVESQILQTRTLIDYATIQVSISESPQAAPLAMTLAAAPKSGESPLSVTFNAVVKGGAQPYVVNYNFGDGTTSQGQIVIHTYYQPGDYNVTVTATDQNGTSVAHSVMVHVSPVPGRSQFYGFLGTVSGLLVSVVEGIAEVAVVVLPIAAVAAAIVIPIQRRARSQKSARPPQ